MDKSLGTNLHFWGIFLITNAKPFLHPTVNSNGHLFSEFIPSFNIV